MTDSQTTTTAPAAASETALPAMLLLFIGSGAAALIYEIVWFQLLQLVIGSSGVSIGVLLGTFMGGMCLGSLLLPRVISPRHHPLRVYAALELGIGVIGLLVLWFMPLVGSLYTAWGGYGISGFVLRGIAAAVCLLPPTLLMGATLPAVARWVETTPRGVSWLGFFYGGNIAGAVCGCLLAGFYLLRVYDMSIATYVAVGINVVVALLGFVLASLVPATNGSLASASPDRSTSVEDRPSESASLSTTPVYVAIAMSGFCALAAEVIWTRLLGLLFGASIYTFSIILAVFLVGLGIGSSVGALLARSVRSPRVALGWCQMLVACSIAWTAYMLADSLPYWPINPSISSSIWLNFQLDLARGFWAMLPPALLWGASFPLALAAAASKGQDPGKLVGGVYAANTVGAIFGALSASMLLIVWMGSQHAQQVLMGVSTAAGLLVLIPMAKGMKGSVPERGWSSAVILLIATGVAALLAGRVPPVPRILIAYGRYAATWVGQNDIFYAGEGRESSVAVSRASGGALNYHNAGKVQASSEPQDMRLQRMLGHLTTLIPKNATSVLVIGCGAGVTAGAVSISPRVKHVTIAEIEPLVPQVVSTYFGKENYDVVKNPKVTVRYDDARHFLLTTKEKFDAITSDPFDPWVRGAATLYTEEFFNIAKQRLNPGGVVTVFVQLYESNLEAVKSEVATFMAAFPNGVVWGNTKDGAGYDMVLSGQVEPTQINLEEMEQRLTQQDFEPVAQSLREIGFSTAVDLFGTYAGRGKDLGAWFKDAQINRDRNLRLQYLAGLGLNFYQSGSIYADMLAHRQFPEGLFTGPDAMVQNVRAAIERPGP